MNRDSFKMFYLVAASILLAFAAAALPPRVRIPSLDGRIVGGEDVSIEEYPYQISLLYYGSHICGGSIISPAFVVTAAHCTYGTAVETLSIRAGSSIRNSGGSVVNVATFYENPNFDFETLDYDITVLALSSPLIFGSGIAAIDLPVQDQVVVVGSDSIVTGWGRLTEGGALPSQLQAVQVQIISLDECRNAYGEGEITDRMICAGVTGGGKDACQGDSGGPLVINGQLIGIVSGGYGCASPIYPGVYASVPVLRSYITSVSNI